MNRRGLLAVLLWLSAGAVSGAAADLSPPDQSVRVFYDALLKVMKNSNELAFDGRYKLLDPVVRQTFDLAYMARTAVGPQWAKFDPAMQQRLTADFADWTVATYASQFDNYDGEKLDVRDTVDAPNNDKLVKTTLTPPDGKAIVLNYLMRPAEAGWKVVDVYLTGTISELATRRSEFTAIMREDGPEGLAQSLEKRIGQLKGAK